MADLFGNLDGRTDSVASQRAREADYTPVGVALQLLLALREEGLAWVLPARRRGQVRQRERRASGALIANKAEHAYFPEVGRRPGKAPPLSVLVEWLKQKGVRPPPPKPPKISRDWRPRRMLDPSAGSGCWGRVARAVFGPDISLTAIEPEESERACVMDAYDHSFHSDLADVLRVVGPLAERDRFDFVITNPPFTAAFEDNWPGLLWRSGWLTDDAIVALVGLTQWGQAAEAQAALRAWSPCLQLRLGGRPAFREDGKTDSREYCLWVWSVREGIHNVPSCERRPMPTWRTLQLPTLPTALRRWSPAAVPGTFPIDQALVDEVRRFV